MLLKAIHCVSHLSQKITIRPTRHIFPFVLAVPSPLFYVPGHDFWDHLLHNLPETEVRLVVPLVVVFALLFGFF